MISEIILAMIPLCAPDVAPNTLVQLMHVESAGDPLAIHVNGIGNVKASSQGEATALLRRYLSAGYSVDVGLMQINSGNFKALGYGEAELEHLFDPCTNIAAGASILKAFYLKAQQFYADDTRALSAAISAYNTGDFQRGINNGYVRKVYSGEVVAYPSPEMKVLRLAIHATTTVDLGEPFKKHFVKKQLEE